jgi:hypothetical protein
MEKPRRCFLLPAAVAALCLSLIFPASAQLVLGQYEDEAPLRTWNGFGVPSAAAVGLGGLSFARAQESTTSLTNPALLTSLSGYSTTLSGAYSAASLFKYSLVNTGVIATGGNLVAGTYGLDAGSLSLRLGSWAFAAAVGLLESYGRPGVRAVDSSLTYSLEMSQSGHLRVFHAAAARRVGAGFSAGLGINYVAGRLSRSILEVYSYLTGPITITDDKEEKYRGLFLNGGITWELSGRLTLALVFRSPYIKKADGRSALRYQAPAAGTDIEIDAEAQNEYHQPWIFGAGGCYRLSAAWTMNADVAFFGWSRYQVRFFDEPQARLFRDVLKAGVGVEYLASSKIFGHAAHVPLRLGVSYDPQPMDSPRSSYLSIGAGTGFRFPALALDLSGSIGRETGSGNSLTAGQVVLTFTYILNR